MTTKNIARFKPSAEEVDEIMSRTPFDQQMSIHYLTVQKMEETVTELREAKCLPVSDERLLDLIEALLPSRTPWW